MRVDLSLDVDHQLRTAVALQNAGKLSEAREGYQHVLDDMPTNATANHNLAVIELDENNLDRSLVLFKTALEANPEEPVYWKSYIGALIEAKHYEDAELVLGYGIEAGLAGADIDLLVDALILHVKLLESPDVSVELALFNLFESQKFQELESKVLVLLEQYPKWLNGWKILSDTLLTQGKDARYPALKALELNVEDAQEHCYFGLVLKKQGDLKGAVSAFEQAIRLSPDYAAAYNNLGIVQKDMGDVVAGVKAYRQAIKLNPNAAVFYSNLLFCLSHDEQISTQALLEEHLQFAKTFEAPFKASWPRHTNSKIPDRCLRVGFVSSAFRSHSIASFIAPLLPYLSKSPHLSLVAYATSVTEDDTTQSLKRFFKDWNHVSALSAKALAHKVLSDEIDILIDLDGHSADNRLLTFALKPAPIQVTWLGYLATTGLTAMDYYLADSYLVPPKQYDAQFVEKLVQLPVNAPFISSEFAPVVNKLPALSNGYITFACFNRPNKITRTTVALWSKLMVALPSSKMLIGAMPNDGSYENLIAWFDEAGVSCERLDFRPRGNMEYYLSLHHEVDICLDTFPSNGVTTTCHAVSMGVPTLCITGNSMTSRGGMAIMQHIGMNDFVVENEQAFVEKGLYWANHTAELSEVRNTLREKFNQSALAKPEQLAMSLEQAFRHMWQIWCDGQSASTFKV